MQPSSTTAVSRRLRVATPVPAPPQPVTPLILHAFTGAVVDICRNAERNLTVRQMGVLLTVALQPGPHTAGALAAVLDISAPAMTQMLNRLSKLGLTKRQLDPTDRRRVLVTAQAKGHRVVRRIGDSLRGHAAGGEAA